MQIKNKTNIRKCNERQTERKSDGQIDNSNGNKFKQQFYTAKTKYNEINVYFCLNLNLY